MGLSQTATGLQSALVISISRWIPGNEQVLHHRGGLHLCSSQCCQSKGIHPFTTSGHHTPLFWKWLWSTRGDASGTVDTEQAAPRRVGKASQSVSIFARAPVCPVTRAGTAGANLVTLRLHMMITLAMTVSRGCCFPNEYLHGNSRSCLCVTPGVRSVLPNGVDFVVLMNVIYACGVSERRRCSLPPQGAGTPGQKEKKRRHEPAAC